MPSEVVRECPWETESMTIAELLTSQRRWGRTRARKFLMPLSLNENKQLGTLTSRQRRLLAAELSAGAREGKRWPFRRAVLSRERGSLRWMLGIPSPAPPAREAAHPDGRVRGRFSRACRRSCS